MNHAELLARLLPPVAYQPNQPRLAAELTAEGKALDNAQAYSDKVLAAITPFGAGEMITGWERVCGITPPANAGYQQRLQAVLAKLAETGGLDIPYFTRLANGLGYTVTIEEPQPFRVGTSRAGDAINHHDVIWCWRVHVAAGSTGLLYQCRAGVSCSGERLLAFGDPVIEAVFTDLKPAWTFVDFAYQGS
ncbi:YmfQ family protein [Chitinibacter sp. S2-10]|uniref:YmfQ family protein n=1 Tax=Chitinibacter sp. S2-10 TaxID=3373597 RepID=UPI00397774B8